MRPGEACVVQMLSLKTKRERKPNPRAAGSRIMRMHLTVNFKTGMRRCSARQERERDLIIVIH